MIVPAQSLARSVHHISAPRTTGDCATARPPSPSPSAAPSPRRSATARPPCSPSAASWHLGICIASADLVRSKAVHTSGAAAQNHATYQWLDENLRLLPTTANGSLKLRIERDRALITDRGQVDDIPELEGEMRVPLSANERVALIVTNRKSGERLDFP